MERTNDRQWMFTRGEGPVRSAKLLLPGRETRCRDLITVMGTEEGEAWLGEPESALLLLSPGDWNRDFSPWPAPAVFRGEDFAGGGEETLSLLRRELWPEVREVWPFERIWTIGYSLGGLFALWAAVSDPEISGCAAVSGSFWYDGFPDFLRERCRNMAPGEGGLSFAYLSVGDREKRARNERMARVETCMEEIGEILRDSGCETVLRRNPGNHFQDPEGRLSLGLAALREAMGR